MNLQNKGQPPIDNATSRNPETCQPRLTTWSTPVNAVVSAPAPMLESLDRQSVPIQILRCAVCHMGSLSIKIAAILSDKQYIRSRVGTDWPNSSSITKPRPHRMA